MRVRKSGPKNLFARIKPPRLNARGFSLMEIMVTVGILGVVAIGTSVLFSDMFALQKRADIGRVLQQQRNDMIAALTRSNTTVVGPGADYSSAWARMLGEAAAQNPDLVCLTNNTKCLKTGGLVNPVLLNVRDNGGVEIFNSRIANRGVAVNGTLCSAFSTATPNPMCPFRWVVQASFLCVGDNKPDCENPTLRFTGTLLYAPGNNPAFGTSFNTAAYGFDVRRGDKPDLNMPIRISYVEDNNSGEATGLGDTCKNRWVLRRLNTLDAPHGNASLAGDRFTLALGGYDCRVQVPAFKNGTNKIRMIGSSPAFTFTSQSAVAALNGGSATLTIQATFVLTAPMSFGIEHTCTHNPSEGTGPPGTHNDNYSLGVPVNENAAGPYSGVVYTVVNCIKTS